MIFLSRKFLGANSVTILVVLHSRNTIHIALGERAITTHSHKPSPTHRPNVANKLHHPSKLPLQSNNLPQLLPVRAMQSSLCSAINLYGMRARRTDCDSNKLQLHSFLLLLIYFGCTGLLQREKKSLLDRIAPRGTRVSECHVVPRSLRSLTPFTERRRWTITGIILIRTETDCDPNACNIHAFPKAAPKPAHSRSAAIPMCEFTPLRIFTQNTEEGIGCSTISPMDEAKGS